MDKTMNSLSLARKAGLAELGEEPVCAAARAGKAYVIIVAKDASDHTWRRALSAAAGTDQQCIRMDHPKDEMGLAVGRESLALAAITDPGMALSLVRSLGRPRDAEVIEVLANKAARKKQRQSEARAHERNKRMGKK